jgi:Concanavalin A-like lectin/glucanases superfamily
MPSGSAGRRVTAVDPWYARDGCVLPLSLEVLTAAAALFGLQVACTAPNPLYQLRQGDAAPPALDERPPYMFLDAGEPFPDRAPEPDLGPGAAEADSAPDNPDAVPTVDCPGDPDLIACFRFEKSLADESPNRLQFSNPSAVTYEPVAERGFALRHELATRLVVDTTLLDAPRFTVQTCVAPGVLPPAGERAALLDYQRQYALFVHPEGDVSCSVRGIPDNVVVTARGAVAAGVWTSLACTMDGSIVTVWVNGVAADWRFATTLPPPVGDGHAGIGSNIPSPDSPNADAFDGLIDDLRIWKRLRSADELRDAALACR